MSKYCRCALTKVITSVDPYKACVPMTAFEGPHSGPKGTSLGSTVTLLFRARYFDSRLFMVLPYKVCVPMTAFKLPHKSPMKFEHPRVSSKAGKSTVSWITDIG